MSDFDSSSFARMEETGWANADTASYYADNFAVAAEFAVPVLADAVRAGDGVSVLDLCCGHGNVAAGLIGAGAAVTAVDFSPAMIELAQTRVPEARCLVGDAMNLSFDDCAFDAVTMGFGMLHLPDAERAVSEIWRVLKPGGRFAYSVWHPPTIPAGIGYLFDAVAEKGNPKVQLPPGPGLFDYAQPEAVDPMLEAQGFEQVKWQRVDGYWVADHADAPVTMFAEGTVRGRALLSAQTPEDLEAIRAAVAAKVKAAHGAQAPWTIPMPSLVVSCRKA